MMTIKEIKEGLHKVKTQTEIMTDLLNKGDAIFKKWAENGMSDSKKIEDINQDSSYELRVEILDHLNQILRHSEHMQVDYKKDQDDVLDGSKDDVKNKERIFEFIDNFKPAEEDVEFYCHYEFESWETGNMEGDVSENFATLREAYEHAEICYHNYKKCDNMVILQTLEEGDEVVMSVDKDGHWIKGGEDW